MKGGRDELKKLLYFTFLYKNRADFRSTHVVNNKHAGTGIHHDNVQNYTGAF